jgi:adhesin HecA-like repeat protein
MGSQGQLDVSQGQLDVSQGQLDVSQGQLDVSQGQLDLFWGQLDLFQGQLDLFCGWVMGWSICGWSTMPNIPLGLVHIFLIWAILLAWTIPLVMLHVTRCLGGYLSKTPADYPLIYRPFA